MQRISVVISAYNESKKIRECLASVKGLADEIIVIDNSSTDGTGTIAKSYGAKVFRRANNFMLNVNKNFGFSKAKNDWILNLDADERITENLKNEIVSTFEKELSENIVAFTIPRKNMIFGKWIQHTGWYPDFQLRLFRKKHGKFLEKHVHEQLMITGEKKDLTEPMTHESYATIGEFLTKFFTIYAPNEADQLIKSDTYSFRPTDFIKRPFQEFTKRFYAEEGYKDGLHGLVLSLLMAFYHFVVVCLIWEKMKFIDNQKHVEKMVKREIEILKHDYLYWHHSYKMNDTKNPINKTYHRLRRKLSR